MSTTPPPPGPAAGGRTSENASGTVALACGILSFLACPLVLSIVAIIYGKRGMASAAAGRADNGGQAKAGYIMGIISLIMAIVLVGIFLVFFVIIAANSGSRT